MMYYRDQFMPESDVRISPDDRGYYFGDGIYEVFRIYNGQLFEKELHYKRLIRTAEQVRIELPYPIEEINSILEQLVRETNTMLGTLYVQITRGEAPRIHPFPDKSTKPVMMAYCRDADRPLAAMENGITAVTADDIRWLRCDLKTLNLLGNVMLKQSALDKGADEVILHRNGTVTECSASNVMMVKNNKVFTHPADNLILHGVTRAVVLKLAAQTGIEFAERAFQVHDLYNADEVFSTGTTGEVMPIVQVDKRTIGDGVSGPITRKLQMLFTQHIERGSNK
ncbi:D-amino-acid transaminase [Paenibacillus sp. N1-5-1-14]|uniref:D-amino-acid transaminase n=1 Tax=Paenibacillus radicibacter TaxID=2972488 RepID=UPI00215902E0|nr:D-amino-acid transaminase [Paenibacillus radicibacter]MCR8643940.1 D-amino-acid transaminase [Paenibacillus radicibacter]